MHIEKLYFVQPVIVEYRDENNLLSRKLVYFDMVSKAVVNPFVDGNQLNLVNSTIDLLEASKKINELIKYIPKLDDNDDFIFQNQTNINNIIKNIEETSIDELGKAQL